MSDNKELVRVARAWKVSPFDDYAGKVALVGQLCDALEVADEATRALIAEVRELGAEVERLKGELKTARLFIADQYATEADADKGEWLEPEARPIYASICQALEAKP